MADMLALNTVYNHYLTTYAHSSVSKYDTHKKSELRDIYNSIVKLNKESPLYLQDNNRESQIYAIGVKEGARELHNIIASLGGLDEEELLSKKVAHSSNEDMISAQYIGNADNDADIPSFDIEVRALASPQVNMGAFLKSDGLQLPYGTYSFDISIHNMNYEFQYNIQEGDTNRSIQEKLARLISNADIGVEASVETQDDLSALRLVSSSTGVPIGKESLFTVSDTHSSRTSGSVDYFGIGEVTRPSTNAELVINGVERSTSSNHFTLEKTYELTLNGISPVEGQTALISVKNDVESAGENINKLIEGYNSFLDTASQNADKQARSNRLLREMRGIASIYRDGLGNMGVNISESGALTLNSQAFAQSMETEDVKQTISSVREFADSLFRKTNQISLNPMYYVNRKIVAYKNPGRNFVTPYITSPYSGMMFNSYC